jgi:hypothetical protein
MAVMQLGTPVIEYRGVLPSFEPHDQADPGEHAHQPPPSKASPGGLILNTLWPLGRDLQGALAAGNERGALDMAYRALSRLCDDLATMAGSARPAAHQARIHALLIELQPLPLACRADGTLASAGAAVRVQYRNWLIGADQAAILAEALIERCQHLWPNVWIIR